MNYIIKELSLLISENNILKFLKLLLNHQLPYIKTEQKCEKYDGYLYHNFRRRAATNFGLISFSRFFK